MLELVDSLNLRLSDASRKRSNRFSDRGYSLTGKTAILHIVISGSSPDVSKIATTTTTMFLLVIYKHIIFIVYK